MNLMKPIWATALAATLFVAAACSSSGGVATPGEPAGPSSPSAPVATSPTTPNRTPSTAPTAASTPTVVLTAAPSATAAPRVDLSNVEACTLLDEADVRELTGTSADFLADDMGSSEPRCFWGATTAGEPAYVQLDLEARPKGLSGFTGMPSNWECTAVPVAGVGMEAVGGKCQGSGQSKVYLTAWDKGLRVTLYVNEPKGALEPLDIGPDIGNIFRQVLPDCDATFC